MNEKLRSLSPQAWKTHNMIWIGNPTCLLQGHGFERKIGKRGEWLECQRCHFIVFTKGNRVYKNIIKGEYCPRTTNLCVGESCSDYDTDGCQIYFSSGREV